MNRIGIRIAAALLACAAWSASAQVVISQVYGGGGNSGATLKSDFIELRNNGSAPVDLGGWSVQYASASGGTWQRTALSGTIAPGGYFLIKQADGSGGSVDLPTPDAIGTIPMSGSAGKVALVAGTTVLSGTCPLGGAVVDFVGYGAANCAETAPTPALGSTTAAIRNGGGSVDTGNNSADFALGAPHPRNSGTQAPEPPLALAISRIQGDGPLSPYDGKRVVTEGIVTARRFNNGFFLQAANDDGDPATSDAIFVFTGAAPPAEAAVGNRVRVTATVDEFVPASNPNQLSITELVSVERVDVLDTGVALPAPVELTAAELSPAATPATLERFEAMRVRVAGAVAISPAGGTIDEDDALSFTDGVFHVVLPGVPRPFREPGIGVLDAFPIPAGKQPPRFDTNPERLMIRSRGQIGAAPLAVDVGAQLTDLAGVLDYNSGTWALLPDPATPPTVSGGMTPRAVEDAAPEDVTVAGFNLLRLFDEIADGNGAPTIKPDALDRRLTKAARAICDYLKAPDILGVVEVENLRVLGLLAERINATCPRAPAYAPYLVEGNDVGGIDVGFLVATREVAPGTPRVAVQDVTQFGKDATFANPDGTTSLLNDRPPLRLRAVVNHANGARFPLTVIANHLRSLKDMDALTPGANGWSTDGERVRAKRAAQAAYLAGLVQRFQQDDPAEKIVLLGDFNAFEFNDGYVDVLGIVKGEEAPAEQVVTYVDSPLTTPLIDGSQLIADPAERYSYVFDGNAQTLDHVLVNEALVLAADLLQVDHARINADFDVVDFGDAAKPTRVSDHDPVRLRIAVPAFRSADLSMTLAASRTAARAGERVRFDATVRNAGPHAAEFPATAFVFDAPVTPTVAAPSGWNCTAPANDPATTTVTCSASTLAAANDAAFALDLDMPALGDGGVLTLAASARSQTADPANGDNGARAQVAVQTAADLGVRIAGSALPVRRGAVASFVVPLRNAGPDAARGVRLVIEGNVAAGSAAVAAPPGWICARSAVPTGFRAECRHPDARAVGTEWFGFAVVVPQRPVRGTALEFVASVEAVTPDPIAANNRATLQVTLQR